MEDIKCGMKFRIYPTPEQARVLDRTFAACHFFWNSIIALNQDNWKSTKKNLTQDQIRGLLRDLLSKDESKWIGTVPLTYFDNVISIYRDAWKTFFNRLEELKAGLTVQKFGRPTFKNRNSRKSFGWHQAFRILAKDGSVVFQDSGLKGVEIEGKKRKKRLLNVVRVSSKTPFYFLHNLSMIGKIKAVFPKGCFDNIVDIKNFRISKKADRYFLSFSVVKRIPEPVFEGPTVGIDLGIKTFAMCSDGTEYHQPDFMGVQEKKLKRLQRSASRKMLTCPKCGHVSQKPMRKGQRSWKCECGFLVEPKRSKRLRETKQKIARIHLKVACQREAFQHNMTHDLTTRNGKVIIETLRVKNMMSRAKAPQKCPKCEYEHIGPKVTQWICPQCGKQVAPKSRNRLAKKIGRQGWYEVSRQLKYKGAWNGCVVKKVSTWFPSSKTCHVCGYYYKDLKLSERTWNCPNCKTVHDRDKNSSINLELAEAQAVDIGNEILSDDQSTFVQNGTTNARGHDGSVQCCQGDTDATSVDEAGMI